MPHAHFRRRVRVHMVVGNKLSASISMRLDLGFLSVRHVCHRGGRGKQETKGGEEEEDLEELAGTVEVCFDKRGASASPPTPTPPKNAPYICNMAVKQSHRRRGIGWNLLKASEVLISEMSSMRDVYLHCRVIDSAPFNMYTKQVTTSLKLIAYGLRYGIFFTNGHVEVMKHVSEVLQHIVWPGCGDHPVKLVLARNSI